MEDGQVTEAIEARRKAGRAYWRRLKHEDPKEYKKRLVRNRKNAAKWRRENRERVQEYEAGRKPRRRKFDEHG